MVWRLPHVQIDLIPLSEFQFLNLEPVVPIVFSHYKNVKLNRWNSGKIIVQVLPPISTIGLTAADASSIKDAAYQSMHEALLRIDQELKNYHE